MPVLPGVSAQPKQGGRQHFLLHLVHHLTAGIADADVDAAAVGCIMDPLDQTAFLKNLDHMGELLLCDTQLVRQLRHGIVLICPAVERDQGEKNGSELTFISWLGW